MEDNQKIYQIINSKVGEEKTIEGKLFLVRGNDAEEIVDADIDLSPGEKIVSFSRSDFSGRIYIVKEAPELPVYTAEEWLNKMEYTSIRLVTLMDLENKLNAVNKESAKLTAVRSWINSILASYIQNPISLENWQPAPFSFEETVREAFMVLSS
jgi:hypothetical protein